MAVFVAGLVGIVVFYLVILAVGVWASRLAKDNSEEEMMLAGRSLGFTVGALTLVATWVGGGYINGAAEVMYRSGLVWAQVPIGYSIALLVGCFMWKLKATGVVLTVLLVTMLVGALMFVRPMREMGCVTLLDPFQRKYGDRIGGLLFIPCIFGDFFWVASILNALGSSLVVITDLNPYVSVILSAIFIAAYTSVGAMYSVTYTDVLQMFFILFGLVLSVPFAALSRYVPEGHLQQVDWAGHLDTDDIWEWCDVMLLLILGGIPWQGYMQRILAIKSTKTAQILSIASMVGCVIMALPAVLVGLIARGVDWSAVESLNRTVTEEDSSIILPLVLRYLTPPWVAFFGLGAISAAVMSSADSSVLAFSAMFSRNLYKNIFRAKASDKEVLWVLRVTVLIISSLSAAIALTVRSIYYLSLLSSDLIYVILFPQLLLVIYWQKGVNSYGCLASMFIGGLVRVLGGERGMHIPAVIKYPYYDEATSRQRFPHRTFAMLMSLMGHVLFSSLANFIFTRKLLSKKYDFLHVFRNMRSPDNSLMNLADPGDKPGREREKEASTSKASQEVGSRSSLMMIKDDSVENLKRVMVEVTEVTEGRIAGREEKTTIKAKTSSIS